MNEEFKFRIIASASLRIIESSTTSAGIFHDSENVHNFKYSAFVRRYQDEDIDNSNCPSYYFTLSDTDHTNIALTSQMVLEPSLQVVRQQHDHYEDHCRRQKRTGKTKSVHESFHKIITLHDYLPSSHPC